MTITDIAIVGQRPAFCGTFQNTDATQKARVVFLRERSCPGTEKPVFPCQQMAEAFGNKDRRDIDKNLREFRKRGGDFLQDRTRKQTTKDRLFPESAPQMLTAPLVTLAEQDRIVCEPPPHDHLCGHTIRGDVNAMAVTKILPRVQHVDFHQEQARDVKRDRQEVVARDRFRPAKHAAIVARFPDVQKTSSMPTVVWGEAARSSSRQQNVLVVLWSACALSQEMLALVFGVGNASLQPWLYAIGDEEVEWRLVREIVRWRGQGSVAETWGTIDRPWWCVRWAVAAVSGFPRRMRLSPTRDTVRWPLFFQRFKARDGLPRQIQCDGSRALATAREGAGLGDGIRGVHSIHARS